jgi:hypothetical protein
MISTRRRYFIPLATFAVLSVTSTATPAFADGGSSSAGLSATLTSGSIGSRSITSVSPVTLTSALNTATASGAMATTVTEAARGGTAAWSLTAVSSLLAKTGGTSADDIAASNLSIANRAVTPVAGGGTSTAATGSSSLATDATLFSNSGQSVTSLYTGTYAATGTITLAVPNGQSVGAYTGTLTVTLVQ